MIVKNTSDGWKVITQTNHAFLAAQIAQAISSKYKTEFWLETILAIYNHETLETDYNAGERINDLGMPIDFRQNKSSKKDLYNKVEMMIHKSTNRSLIVGGLVARHLQFLHNSDINRKHISDLIENTIAQAKSVHKINDTTFEKMYGVVRFADRLSLMMVTEEFPDLNRYFDINDSLSGSNIELGVKGDLLKIRPWPFEKEQLSVYYEYRLLKTSTFSDNDDFIKKFQKSYIESKVFKLVK